MFRKVLIVFQLLFIPAYCDAFSPCTYPWFLGFYYIADVKPPMTGFRNHEVIEQMINYDPQIYLDNIKDGSIVWIHNGDLMRFEHDVLRHIDHNIILISGGDDRTFPDEYEGGAGKILEHIDSGKIAHLFVQNSIVHNENITCIPLGIDFHTAWHWPDRLQLDKFLSLKQQEDELTTLIKHLKPTNQREKTMFCDFYFNDTMKRWKSTKLKFFNIDRTQIHRKLRNKSFYRFPDKKMPRDLLWNTKKECVFDISPPGGGLDCHRTWESLLLGCIVIVQKSPLNQLFEGLPIVEVDSWNEINQENLNKWKKEFGNVLANQNARKRLTFEYWSDKIILAQKKYMQTRTVH